MPARRPFLVVTTLNRALSEDEVRAIGVIAAEGKGRLVLATSLPAGQGRRRLGGQIVLLIVAVAPQVACGMVEVMVRATCGPNARVVDTNVTPVDRPLDHRGVELALPT